MFFDAWTGDSQLDGSHVVRHPDALVGVVCQRTGRSLYSTAHTGCRATVTGGGRPAVVETTPLLLARAV